MPPPRGRLLIPEIYMTKTISVLGATGSVGMQALDVARHAEIKVDLLSAKSDVCGMQALAREFMPTYCVMADEEAARALRTSLADTDRRDIHHGDE